MKTRRWLEQQRKMIKSSVDYFYGEFHFQFKFISRLFIDFKHQENVQQKFTWQNIYGTITEEKENIYIKMWIKCSKKQTFNLNSTDKVFHDVI